jgi:hypothetical protein
MSRVNSPAFFIGQQMKVLEDKSNIELLQSIIAEMAKMSNELKCSQQDISKAQSRLTFFLVTANEMINRIKD